MPSASSRSLNSGSIQAFATSLEPPLGPIDSRPFGEPPVVLGGEQALLDGELADRRLQDLELADLVGCLDRVVGAVVVVMRSLSFTLSFAGSSQRSETSVSSVSTSNPV